MSRKLPSNRGRGFAWVKQHAMAATKTVNRNESSRGQRQLEGASAVVASTTKALEMSATRHAVILLAAAFFFEESFGRRCVIPEERCIIRLHLIQLRLPLSAFWGNAGD
jgi:hypothetical protein